METVLIVDDDTELCELVGRYLERDGLRVEAVHDGAQGAEKVLASPDDYALVVLDVMLPSLSGFDVLRRVRERSQIPVIMLTARGEETDRIVGLEIGADDYLPKPFNPRELSARIRAILRRAKGAPPGDASRLRVGDVDVDPSARLARRDGHEVELTGAEFDLLTVLLRNAGTVVSREELVRTVLSRPLMPYDRSIDTLTSNLRRKLGPTASGHERIKSLRGVGYVYVKDES